MGYLLFIVGLMSGIIISYFIIRPKVMGNLRIYESDDPSEKPYMFVELNKPLEDVCQYKNVCFKISLK